MFVSQSSCFYNPKIALDIPLHMLIPPASHSCMALHPQSASPSSATLSTAISSASATSSLNLRLEHDSLTPRFIQIYNILEAGQRSGSSTSLLSLGSSHLSGNFSPLLMSQSVDSSKYLQIDKKVKNLMRHSKSPHKSQSE